MDETFGAGGFDGNTSVSIPNDNKPQGVAPLVIKQIHDFKENTIQLYGLTIGMCSLVGIVRNIDHTSTKITYRLEDHTGQIYAHFWLEDGANANAGSTSGPPIIVNTYCRVYGSVRSQNDVRTIMLFKIEPITSINEVTTHLLEVLNARYTAEKFSKSEYGSEFAGSVANNFNTLTVSNNGGGAPATTAPTPESATGLKGKDLAVFQAIRQHPGDVGISFDDLLRKFSHINDAEMRKITEFMTQEGHIYTSIDADHFLSTENM